MPSGPAAVGDQRRARAACARRRRVVGRLAGEQRERFGLQPVAGENGHAVAADDVQRRPPAAQRVVVHRRQVVVDRASRCGSVRSRRRPAAPASAPPGATRRAPRRRRRRRPGSGSAAAACRRPSRCSASPRRPRPGSAAGAAGTDRGPRPPRRGTRSAKAVERRSRHRSSSWLTSARPGGAAVQLAALVEDLDAPLGGVEPRVAEARQLHAALVERERRLEREVAVFELLDDRLRARRSPLRSP